VRIKTNMVSRTQQNKKFDPKPKPQDKRPRIVLITTTTSFCRALWCLLPRIRRTPNLAPHQEFSGSSEHTQKSSRGQISAFCRARAGSGRHVLRFSSTAPQSSHSHSKQYIWRSFARRSSRGRLGSTYAMVISSPARMRRRAERERDKVGKSHSCHAFGLQLIL
jgi:hypothetical protein